MLCDIEQNEGGGMWYTFIPEITVFLNNGLKD